jgi:hypothetical protein
VIESWHASFQNKAGLINADGLSEGASGQVEPFW